MEGNKLLEIIQKASKPNPSELTDMVVGQVTSISPLKVKVENRFELEGDFLILTKNVKDYTLEVTMNWSTESVANHTHSYSGSTDNSPVNVNGTNYNHSHPYSGTTQGAGQHSHSMSGTKSITIHNALKVGDTVLMLRVRQGQKFVIIDKL